MYTLERHEEIMNLLENKKSISVVKLAELLHVSLPTIRRDLSILEEHGKVHRTHGGVVLRRTSEAEIPLMFREDQNSHAKQIIAQKAAPLIHDGDVIFLDASSTVSFLRMDLVTFSIICPAASRKEADPLNTGVTKVSSTCSSSSSDAFIFTS